MRRTVVDEHVHAAWFDDFNMRREVLKPTETRSAVATDEDTVPMFERVRPAGLVVPPARVPNLCINHRSNRTLRMRALRLGLLCAVCAVTNQQHSDPVSFKRRCEKSAPAFDRTYLGDLRSELDHVTDCHATRDDGPNDNSPAAWDLDQALDSDVSTGSHPEIVGSDQQ